MDRWPERRLRSERGSGYAEYILIVALVAIALIAATRFYQDQIEMVFRRSADEIAGNTAIIEE